MQIVGNTCLTESSELIYCNINLKPLLFTNHNEITGSVAYEMMPTETHSNMILISRCLDIFDISYFRK